MRMVFNEVKVNDTAFISIKFKNKIIGSIFINLKNLISIKLNL